MAEWTDESVALAVLTELRARGLVTLREMEEVAPVSRGTLNRWLKGDYSMMATTQRDLLRWLDALPVRESPGYADGALMAVEQIQTALDELRRRLEPPGGPDPTDELEGDTEGGPPGDDPPLDETG